MKKLFYLIIAIIFIGCANNSNENQKFTEKKSAEPKEVDRNLKEIAQEYLNTKLTFDIEKASQYMHPISWELLKLKLPEENGIASIKRKIKEIYLTSGIEQTNREYNMRIIVGDIIGSYSFKEDYIYLLVYERIGETKYDNIYVKSIIIAITDNKGDSWKFIGIDTEFLSQTKKMLANIYPENIVNGISKSIVEELNFENEEVTFIPLNNIEKNLEMHFNIYMDAFYNGDANKAISYIYSGVFEYLRVLFEDEYSIHEVKSIFKEQNIVEMRKQIGNKRFETSINKILNKVEYRNNLIYVLSYSLESGNQNDMISVGGEAIAISTNNGQDWGFFEKDDESVIPILSMKYPNQIVTKILNYGYEK